jgi:transposase
LVADSGGVPLAVDMTPGQAHESTRFEAVLDLVRLPLKAGGHRRRPGCVAADKGYSYPRIRRWLAQHRIRAVIPRRSNERPAPPTERPFDPVTYRRRNAVERCVGWLKECRRIGTRFEKLAVNYRAMLHLGFIDRYFRILFSDGA